MNDRFRRQRTTRSLVPVAVLGLLSAHVVAQAKPRDKPETPLHPVHAVGEIDGELWAGGKTFKTRFDRGAVEFTPALGARVPRSYPVRFTLASIHRGGHVAHRPTAVEAARSDRDDLLVTYQRGAGIVERYSVRPDGIEQSFAFAARPPGRGDLVVQLHVETDLEGETGRRLDGLYLSAGRHGGVSIGAVTGIDADDARVPGHMNFDGTHLELVLPADFVDRAAYPMVLDPLIGARYSSGQSSDDRRPDVAYDASTDKYLVVYERHVSSSNVDIWGTIHKGDNTQRKGVFLAVGRGVQRHPAVANVASRNRFMVVWQDNASGNWDIRGRSVDSFSGAMSPVVTVAATRAQEITPDVGGESRLADDDVVVVWDDENVGVRARSVELPPGRANPTPRLQHTVTIWPGRTPFKNTPAICKGSGPNGNTCIVWQDDPAFVSARIYTMDLQPRSAACGQSSPNNGVYEPDVDGDGTDFLMVYERRERGRTGPRDIWGWAISAPASASRCPATRARGPIYAAANADEVSPAVSFLGSRYVVACSRPESNGFRVHLVDLLPNSVKPCAASRKLGPSSRAHCWSTAIASRRSAGVTTSGEALVVYEDHYLSNNFHVVFAQRYAATRTGLFRAFRPGGNFGSAIAAIGDIDNDGYPDLGIGHPLANDNNRTRNGIVAFINGRTHRLTYATGASGDLLGTAIAGGDIDDDGWSDVVMGAPGRSGNRGAVAVLWGRRGGWSYHLAGSNRFGKHVAVGDLDAAAGADIVTTDNNGLTVRAYSGASRRLLWSRGVAAAVRALAVVGDVDLDGYDDVGVGMPSYSGSRGRFEIRSGRNGAALRTIVGGLAGQEFGHAIASIGDVNGDRIPEMAIGKPGVSPGFVDVYSFARGFVSAGRGLRANARFGSVVAAAGDLDGDGTPDVLVSSRPASGKNTVEVRSGRRPDTVITTFEGSTPAFGAALAGLDSNGDGKPDVAIGEPTAAGGSAWLHDDDVEPRPAVVKTVGVGCTTARGTLARCEMLGRGAIGTRVVPRMWGGDPNRVAAFRLGLMRPQPLDLTPFGFRGCTSYIQSTVIVGLRTNGAGTAEFPFVTGTRPHFVGAVIGVEFAALARRTNASDIVFTNGVRWKVGAR